MSVADVLDLYEAALRQEFDDQIAMIGAVEVGVLRAEASIAGVELDPLPSYDDRVGEKEEVPEWAMRFQEANRKGRKR